MNSLSLLVQKIFGHALQLFFGILLYKLYKEVFVEYSELTLLYQYISYLYIGLPYAINFYLSSESELNRSKLLSNSSSLILILSFLPILITFSVNVFLNNNIIKTCLITSSIISLNFSVYVYNIWRATDNIYKVNYSAILLFGTLLITSFLTSKFLIYLIIISLHGLIVFLLHLQSIKKLEIDQKFFRLIIEKGFALLIYNISYYLFVQSLRTIIRFRSNDDVFADISLSQSLTNAVFLLMGTLSWIFYSKILSFFSSGYKYHRIKHFISDVGLKYYSIVEFIVYLAFTITIIFYYYSYISYNLNITLLVLLLSNLSIHSIFPVGEYLISKNKQIILTTSSLFALILFSAFAIYIKQDYIIFIFYMSAELYATSVIYRSNFWNRDFLFKLIFRITLFILILNEMYTFFLVIILLRIPFLTTNIYPAYKFISKLKIK